MEGNLVSKIMSRYFTNIWNAPNVLTLIRLFLIPVFVVLSTMATSWILGGDPVMSILTGGVLFGAVFMATDYVTSPMNRWAQIVYAIGIGVIIVVIRNFGDYPEGVTYAILLMNIVTPYINRGIRQRPLGVKRPRRKKEGKPA